MVVLLVASTLLITFLAIQQEALSNRIIANVIPIHHVNHVVAISSKDALRTLLSHPVVRQLEVVAIPVDSLTESNYVSYYIGWLTDLLDQRISPPLFVFFEVRRTEDWADSIFLFKHLPPKNVLIATQHGETKAFCFHLSENIRIKFDLKPSVVFHVGHERPWSVDSGVDLYDALYDSVEKLREAYRSYDLVLRNYFYERLSEDSEYVPIGAPAYHFALGSPSKTMKDLHVSISTPTSQRSTLCFFQGRVEYKHLVDMNMLGEENVLQRQELIDFLVEEGESFPCTVNIVEYNPLMEGSTQVYLEYINRIKDSVFVLCPLGNNPETFRIYEALELRAIPLIMKTSHPERDFFSHSLWWDYPGPVFDSLYKVSEFLQSVTGIEADDLQQQLSDWYVNFKVKTKSIVRQRIDEVHRRKEQGLSMSKEGISQDVLRRSQEDRRDLHNHHILYFNQSSAGYYMRIYQVLEELVNKSYPQYVALFQSTSSAEIG